MVRSLLIRGMLAGLAAGVAAFAFASLVGEPWVREAIAYEEEAGAADEAAGHDPGGTVVSRTVQSTVGLLAGTAIAGVAMGGLFALVYAFALGRFGPSAARPLALALATGAFTAVALVPFFKYPANPPGVGDPDTVGWRTALYLALIAVAVAGAGLAIVLRRRWLERHDPWNATLLAVGAWLALIALAYVLLPDGAEIPAGFPADVLWGFRVASLGVHAVLWATIGLVYGALNARDLSATAQGSEVSPLV